MFGRKVIGTIGSTIQLLADGSGRHKVGGVTIDWSTVAAVSGSAVTLYDGVVIPVGAKYLRYGQVLTKITATGYYGPYDPTASDGRQTLARGDCYLVNRTVNGDDPRSDYPEVIDGGRVWFDRLIQAGTSTHSLTLGPTRAELEAAFPTLTYATN
ncbi:head decoration protein [Singulisphaera rosea]